MACVLFAQQLPGLPVVLKPAAGAIPGPSTYVGPGIVIPQPPAPGVKQGNPYKNCVATPIYVQTNRIDPLTNQPIVAVAGFFSSNCPTQNIQNIKLMVAPTPPSP